MGFFHSGTEFACVFAIIIIIVVCLFVGGIIGVLIGCGSTYTTVSWGDILDTEDTEDVKEPSVKQQDQEGKPKDK